MRGTGKEVNPGMEAMQAGDLMEQDEAADAEDMVEQLSPLSPTSYPTEPYCCCCW